MSDSIVDQYCRMQDSQLDETVDFPNSVHSTFQSCKVESAGGKTSNSFPSWFLSCGQCVVSSAVGSDHSVLVGNCLWFCLFFMISLALIHDPSYISGFLPKWLIIIELLKNNYILATLIAFMGLINLFFYTSLIYSTSLTTFPTNNNSNIYPLNKTYLPHLS